MRIAIANDHGGYEFKQIIKEDLQGTEHAFVDLGTNDSESVDYPDYAEKVVHYVLHNGYDCGILICGTGIGMSMVANRHRGIRAALCHGPETARLSRQHNNANILCIPARFTDQKTILKIADVFLKTKFEGGRHQRRVDKICLNC